MLVDPGVPEEESLFLYRYEIDGDGNEIFTEIEDESKWEKVRQKAEELLSEEDSSAKISLASACVLLFILLIHQNHRRLKLTQVRRIYSNS